jgi:hypothetical protein
MTDYWFRPKEKGIGPGVPTNWKGWALFLTYVGAILAVPTGFELVLGHQAGVVDRAIAVVALSVPFLYVAWKKTEGGWRWRRDADEDFDDQTER